VGRTVVTISFVHFFEKDPKTGFPSHFDGFLGQQVGRAVAAIENY
jgi:hypothetical protein